MPAVDDPSRQGGDLVLIKLKNFVGLEPLPAALDCRRSEQLRREILDRIADRLGASIEPAILHRPAITPTGRADEQLSRRIHMESGHGLHMGMHGERA